MKTLVYGPGDVDDIEHLLQVRFLVLLLAEVSTNLCQINVLSTEGCLELTHSSMSALIELAKLGQLTLLAGENVFVCHAQVRVLGLRDLTKLFFGKAQS